MTRWATLTMILLLLRSAAFADRPPDRILVGTVDGIAGDRVRVAIAESDSGSRKNLVFVTVTALDGSSSRTFMTRGVVEQWITRIESSCRKAATVRGNESVPETPIVLQNGTKINSSVEGSSSVGNYIALYLEADDATAVCAVDVEAAREFVRLLKEAARRSDL